MTGDRPRNVFLVGPMGSGKTTVGRHLAELLGMRFEDSDRVIEARSGADIPWIFEREGEDGFRKREAEAIDELSRGNGIVLATGGGAVLLECNRRVLHERGVVVFLDPPLAVLYERLARDRKRPLLRRGGNLRDTIRAIVQEREPLYREVAHHRICTDQRSPRVMAEAIAAMLVPERTRTPS